MTYARVRGAALGRGDASASSSPDRPTPRGSTSACRPALARHAAVALALVTGQLAAERDAPTLRARDAERDQFMSTVAHELRTPLTGLRGYLELILDGRVDDPAVEREFLVRSRAIVGSMGELVGDLLELSRLESGTLELEIAPFSVGRGRRAHVAAGAAADRDRARHPPRRPTSRRASASATGDRRRVEQVLTNLAGNALKFTPAGGTVELVARFEGAVAVFIVRDDGRGIGADDRARIFERFERLADHEAVPGTGLGLPIARDLARRMAGDLDVASVPGAGSAFVLVLPGPTGRCAGPRRRGGRLEDGVGCGPLARRRSDATLEERRRPAGAAPATDVARPSDDAVVEPELSTTSEPSGWIRG